MLQAPFTACDCWLPARLAEMKMKIRHLRASAGTFMHSFTRPWQHHTAPACYRFRDRAARSRSNTDMALARFSNPSAPTTASRPAS